MLQGRPLYDNAADAEYFVAPEAWESAERAISRKLNVLVTGRRGIGKTTFLRQLQFALRNRGVDAEFVDGTSVSESLVLAARIRDVLRGRPSAFVAGMGALRVAAGDPSPPPAGASRQLYDDLTAIGQTKPVIVLLDASGSADAVYQLFGRMRDTFWQFEHRWVVAVDEDERSTALKPPADAFFDHVIELEEWSADRLHQMMQIRDPDLDPVLRQRLASEAGGSPRVALRSLNSAALRPADTLAALSERGALLENASALGRPHAMLMAELLDMGQASPSDEQLLQRLGLSRARATQLLRELLSAHLVTAGTERSDAPGRPKTIYRPVSKVPQ